MIRHLLLAAAVVAAAAPQLFKTFAGTCGCRSDLNTTVGVSAYSNAGSGYCPITTMKSCNVTLLTENPSCTITCQGGDARTTLGYNVGLNSFKFTNKIYCDGNVFRNGADEPVENAFRRPTCAQKLPCDQCQVPQLETSCPSGMTCNPDNYVVELQPDGCLRAFCIEGDMKLYNASTHLPYTTFIFASKQLYCTTSNPNKWANYSIDGATQSSAATLDMPVTANCVLPKTCETCTAPTLLTTLAQLPTTFRTGYTIAPVNYHKQNMSCSQISCPTGYKLYGFNSTSTTVTGLEYTNYGFLKCDSSLWKNGGLTAAPANLQSACLAAIPTTTTTTTTTTTPSPCGTWDPLGAGNTVEGGGVSCDGTQAIVDCAGKKIEVTTNDNTFEFENMSFVPGKGWLSFDCDGNAKLWKAGDPDFVMVACKGSF